MIPATTCGAPAPITSCNEKHHEKMGRTKESSDYHACVRGEAAEFLRCRYMSFQCSGVHQRYSFWCLTWLLRKAQAAHEDLLWLVTRKHACFCNFQKLVDLSFCKVFEEAHQSTSRGSVKECCVLRMSRIKVIDSAMSGHTMPARMWFRRRLV